MTRSKTVFASFLLLLVVFLVTHVAKFPGNVAYLREITGGQAMLDMKPSFSAEETYQRLEAFGDVGRKMYMRTILTVDFVFPLTAFLFLFLWSRYASDRVELRASLRKALLSLSIAYVVLDFMENLFILTMLSNFPARLQLPGRYIGYLTLGKRICMLSALVLPAILLLVAKAPALFRGKSA